MALVIECVQSTGRTIDSYRLQQDSQQKNCSSQGNYLQLDKVD